MTSAERIEKAFDDAHVVIAYYLEPGPTSTTASCMTLSWSCLRQKAGRRPSRRTSQRRPRFPLLASQLPEILVRLEAKILRLFRLAARFLPRFPSRASGLELRPALPGTGSLYQFMRQRHYPPSRFNVADR
jgi:hypothetical protein